MGVDVVAAAVDAFVESAAAEPASQHTSAAPCGRPVCPREAVASGTPEPPFPCPLWSQVLQNGGA